MSKSSWEKAFGVADASFNLPSVDNDMDDIKQRQREIQQSGWDEDLSKAREQANKEVLNKADDDGVASGETWAKMYKNVPVTEAQESAELSVEEQILRELERTGHFYKAQGLLGSIKMLINEFNITKHQLASIKRAIGQ